MATDLNLKIKDLSAQMSETNTEKIDKLDVKETRPVDEKSHFHESTLTLAPTPTPGKISPIELDDTSRESGPTDTPAHFDANGNFVERHPAELRKLMWRIDLRIIPWICLLGWLSLFDIGVLGKAKLFGLEKDLGMKGTDFNTLALMSSITHIIFELPSNLVVTRLRPSIWFPGISPLASFALSTLMRCRTCGGMGFDDNVERVDTYLC